MVDLEVSDEKLYEAQFQYITNPLVFISAGFESQGPCREYSETD